MQFRAPAVLPLVCASLGTLLLYCGSVAAAQSSGGGFELHANGNVTASDVGLPVYPGSKLFKSADNDPAVDTIKTARSGLTCGDVTDQHMQVQGNVNSSEDHELRAGTPEKFRIVGIGERQGSAIRFGLVYVEMPKDNGSKKD